MTMTDYHPVADELELRRDPQPAQAVTLFGTDDPDAFLAKAGKSAAALKKMLVECKLVMNIKGRQYVRVEGWTALGSMLGVFAVTEYTRRVEFEGDTGWEARVKVVTAAGNTIGAAEASCMRSEATWKTRDDYALRSMAATRATSKALRQPLGFVISMAGYEATGAEEMPPDVVPASASAPVEVFKPPSKGGKATKQQVAEIEALIMEAVEGGMSATGITGGMIKEYGTPDTADLTKSQATNFLARLKAAKDDSA